jgi:hypothetical protein
VNAARELREWAEREERETKHPEEWLRYASNKQRDTVREIAQDCIRKALLHTDDHPVARQSDQSSLPEQAPPPQARDSDDVNAARELREWAEREERETKHPEEWLRYASNAQRDTVREITQDCMRKALARDTQPDHDHPEPP